MIQLLTALDFERYTPRIYFVSEGDNLSVRKAVELERRKSSPQDQDTVSSKLQNEWHLTDFLVKHFTTLVIPRARRVHQSLIGATPHAITSLLTCLSHILLDPILSRNACCADLDLLIINGPGTCLMLVAAVHVRRVSHPTFETKLEDVTNLTSEDTGLTVSKIDLRRVICPRVALVALW